MEEDGTVLPPPPAAGATAARTSRRKRGKRGKERKYSEHDMRTALKKMALQMHNFGESESPYSVAKDICRSMTNAVRARWPSHGTRRHLARSCAPSCTSASH